MFRNSIVTLMFLTVLSALGCGGSTPANTGANSANSNTSIKLDPANMPPGLSASPVQPGVNTPGIPANISPLPKGTTPTPGIPSPAELKKPFKPGATPTPGIPDPATIRKQMGLPPTNVNAPPAPKADEVPMMKGNRKMAGKPQ